MITFPSPKVTIIRKPNSETLFQNTITEYLVVETFLKNNATSAYLRATVSILKKPCFKSVPTA